VEEEERQAGEEAEDLHDEIIEATRREHVQSHDY